MSKPYRLVSAQHPHPMIDEVHYICDAQGNKVAQVAPIFGALAVRACNSHDGLIAAVRVLLGEGDAYPMPWKMKVMIAETALAEAEGRK